jgi:nicotinamidase-related amidase
MKKTLIVIDMQNDFVTGSLANPMAQAIIPNIKAKIAKYEKDGDEIIFTRDTHRANYLDTAEGKKLPVPHCISGTWGWLVVDELNHPEHHHINKTTFGYPHWSYEDDFEEIELVGTCTDICVVSNALILKAQFPNANITVDASCCAGATPESHKAALTTMKMCQINVIGE